MASMDQLALKSSMEKKRHAREIVEIEVEPVSMCTVRLGEDRDSDEVLWG